MSLDDIIRANNGSFVGLGADFLVRPFENRPYFHEKQVENRIFYLFIICALLPIGFFKRSIRLDSNQADATLNVNGTGDSPSPVQT